MRKPRQGEVHDVPIITQQQLVDLEFEFMSARLQKPMIVTTLVPFPTTCGSKYVSHSHISNFTDVDSSSLNIPSFCSSWLTPTYPLQACLYITSLESFSDFPFFLQNGLDDPPLCHHSIPCKLLPTLTALY